MNRNQAKEFYPILQAFAEGRVIECRTKPSAIEGTDVPNDWTEIKEIEFWKIQNTASNQSQPIDLSRMQKSVGRKWKSISRLGG